jgi:hypothetical protein
VIRDAPMRTLDAITLTPEVSVAMVIVALCLGFAIVWHEQTR